MPHDSTLAAAFEDEVVILDASRGTLMLLDAWAAQVWRSCDGRTTESVASSCQVPHECVRETLQALTNAGLVRAVGNEWTRSPVEWV